MNKAKIKRSLQENLGAYMFVGPFLILASVFMIYPIISGFVTSLYNTKWGKDVFVGLQNYIKLFTTDVYVLAIRNTLLYVIATVPLLIIFGLWIAASVYDKTPKYVSCIRIALYIPVICSMTVMSIIWRYILDSQTGLVGYFSMLLGGESFDLLSDKTWSIVLVIFVLFTMNIGQTVVLYIADMLGISKELIEAATIDGASRWQVFRNILIPLTKPTTIFVFITQTSATLKVFIAIQLLTKGGPNYGTTSLMYLLYQEAFEKSNTGFGCAIGVVMFLMSLILVLIRFVTDRNPRNR